MSAVTKWSGPTALRDIPYDMYVWIRDRPANLGYRMTYYDGTLEIMSPSLWPHERGGRRLHMLINAYTSVLGIDCEGAGSTTFRRGLPGQLKGKGKEPDESFYIAHAADVRGKDSIDLDVDPPPDLWIEVDHRGSAKGRLPVYAELGVPEVWRYRPRGRKLWIGLLQAGSYVQAAESRALPGLTPALVLDLIDEAGRRGESAWDAWLRTWIDHNRDYFRKLRATPGPF